MEYVPGRSLQDRLNKRGPLSLTEVLRIGAQTAAGLAAAHAQGLVHRDVKPANILMEESVERVRLTDFGLARAVADASLTHSGVIAGTPHYMAPEQASGDTVDHRADLFSLGSTLYAACAGHPPFRADSPLAVLRRVCDDRPTRLRAINPEVPAWLEAIIARLMIKDPARRFQAATDVATVLARCLAHVQQPLKTPLPDDIVGHDSGRRRWMRWPNRVLALIAIVVVGVLASAPFRSQRRDLAGSRDQSPGHQARRQSPPEAAPWDRSDDIVTQLAVMRERTTALETQLHHADPGASDLLADQLRDVATRALTLEQALVSEQDESSRVPTIDSFPGSNHRR
jgi:serine/threonine-protein kinase